MLLSGSSRGTRCASGHHSACRGQCWSLRSSVLVGCVRSSLGPSRHPRVIYKEGGAGVSSQTSVPQSSGGAAEGSLTGEGVSAVFSGCQSTIGLQSLHQFTLPFKCESAWPFCESAAPFPLSISVLAQGTAPLDLSLRGRECRLVGQTYTGRQGGSFLGLLLRCPWVVGSRRRSALRVPGWVAGSEGCSPGLSGPPGVHRRRGPGNATWSAVQLGSGCSRGGFAPAGLSWCWRSGQLSDRNSEVAVPYNQAKWGCRPR